MPVSTTTPSRHHRHTSPPSSTVTPMRPASRSTSNYSTYTPTVTSVTGTTKMNVVTRVALEGKSKHGDDGASIKMYLKLSIPFDSVTPGTTIPLFPEENVKILSSQVHPLDNNSVPYNFSSTVSPLLHRAARALNLPARSSETFNSAFGIAPSHTSASSSRISKSESNSEIIPPVDEHHSGHILVSGYSISYVLPRVFPGQSHDYGEEVYSRPSKSRRLSISERSTAQFMAAIDMWVPYVSRPPRSPYLLSIPTPRCLHNHIRLRIFPPNTTSNSYASLSSIDDEGGTWDMTADPHVTRTSSNRLGRSNSYTNFADDESSDSSTTGFADGCGIQGTFPSAERIRIRWAKPSKSVQIPGGGRDGRRRVGVKSVKGEMTCSVRGHGQPVGAIQPEGILMDIEYKATCSGVWFPGVAILLGLDVGLEAKGSEISWAAGAASHWTVNGSNGYTGFDVGPSATAPALPDSRASSFESSSSNDQGVNGPSTSNGFLAAHPQPSRSSSSSSTTSLLRAPLPTTNVADYSFEGSNSSLGSNGSYPSPGTLSSIPSLSISTPNAPLQANPHPPGLPLTLHLNINDLLHPAKNIFTFTISGTIVITPKTSLSRFNGVSSDFTRSTDTESNSDPITLPKFTILAADSESTTTMIRHETDVPNSVIEVYRPTGDIYRDAQAKKTVLRRGGFTKCGEEGGRIVLRWHDPLKFVNASTVTTPSAAVAKAPLGQRHSKATSAISAEDSPDASSISQVSATISPLTKIGSSSTDCYGVTLKLPVPVSKTLETLEFGFASTSDGTPNPKVRVIYATIDGVPVSVESNGKDESSHPTADFESVTGKAWISWVKVDMSLRQGGGDLVLEYLVKLSLDPKGKAKRTNGILDILLPTFPLPVMKLDVYVDVLSDMVLSILDTNMDSQAVGWDSRRFVHYRLPEFFSPRLVVTLTTKPIRTPLKYFLFTWALILFAFLGAAIKLGNNITTILEPARQPLDLESHPNISTTTLTATIFASPVENCNLSGISQLSTPIASSLSPSSPSSSALTISSTIEPHLSEESSPSSLPVHSSTIAVSEKTTSSTPLGIPSLFDLQIFGSDFQFPWNRHFAEFTETYHKFLDGLAVLWKYLRKAYHYPLEAP